MKVLTQCCADPFYPGFLHKSNFAFLGQTLLIYENPYFAHMSWKELGIETYYMF
jgi:hypothetical protein